MITQRAQKTSIHFSRPATMFAAAFLSFTALPTSKAGAISNLNDGLRVNANTQATSIRTACEEAAVQDDVLHEKSCHYASLWFAQKYANHRGLSVPAKRLVNTGLVMESSRRLRLTYVSTQATTLPNIQIPSFLELTDTARDPLQDALSALPFSQIQKENSLSKSDLPSNKKDGNATPKEAPHSEPSEHHESPLLPRPVDQKPEMWKLPTMFGAFGVVTSYLYTSKFVRSGLIGVLSASTSYGTKALTAKFCMAAAVTFLPASLAPVAAGAAIGFMAGFISGGIGFVLTRAFDGKEKKKYWWLRSFARGAVLSSIAGALFGGAIGYEGTIPHLSGVKQVVKMAAVGAKELAGTTFHAASSQAHTIITTLAPSTPVLSVDVPSAAVHSLGHSSDQLGALKAASDSLHAARSVMSKVRAYKDYSALLLKDGYIKQGMAVLKEGLKYARHHGSIHSRAARMMSRDWQVEKLISQGHIKAAAQFYRHFRLG